MEAKKAYSLIPDAVKLPAPEPFLGKHDGESVRNFLNAVDTFFSLTGINDDNTRAYFVKTRL